MSLPVLIVAFSRFENVVKLIDQLQNQGVRKIYLAIDGPKTVNDGLQSQVELVSRARAAALNIELQIWRRECNLGPAVSVITAIDWFFSSEEHGVILEDDLILSSSAIEYFDISLSLFADDKKVFLVSGSNYFSHLQVPPGTTLATHDPVIWGWASWSDRWIGYRTALNQLNDRQISATRKERWFWRTGLRRCLNGIKDAWDIPLVTYLQTQGYLSVLPPVNLVSNCGADEFAGNTLIDEWPLNLAVEHMNETELLKLGANEGDFDKILIENIDLLFREKIYGISKIKILPSGISKIFDLVRFPLSKRDRTLIERLKSVKTPLS